MPHPHEMAVSLAISIGVAVVAIILALRQWHERRHRESDLSGLDASHFARQDLRRLLGVVVMLLLAMGLSAGSRLEPRLGYDLRLMSWGDGSKVPTSGNNLVIVGTDNNGLLHIRIFDPGSNLVMDTDETKLPSTQAVAISTLKKQLPGFLPPHVLTGAEKAQIITDATAIAGHTPRLAGKANPAFVEVWLGVFLLVLILLGLAVLDWVATRLYARRHRRAMARERLEILREEVKIRREMNTGEGLPDYAGNGDGVP